ncbi:alpha/beta fold hydrolase [Fictibacillus fluitans]|uniref:Alpha/beta hydrolase n=1 Tax=Fictibacillus fluitans TaxID=3058422 RepID=A0ABT8HTB2_9BACL|nr:alpha/beta hydrolase [Fictibacillus sp. NE201]MDN4524005.1 alpha/beta hydrolase [Fictibacillus sp. NE201]
MFEHFTLKQIQTGEATLRVRIGGEGPPLLLLHGHPQTHVMWHKIAPLLAKHFTVIAPDLRGYGGSSKPQTDENHYPYSKRAMAKDMISLMDQLGYNEFAVAGHDRGGRVAYRLALDKPEKVTRLAVLDIVPTGEAFRRTTMDFGMGYFHWFFLAQAYDLPEKMIGENPDHFYFNGKKDLFDPEALEDYMRWIKEPGTIHAMCEDYRAGVSFDYELDEADRGNKKIQCPTLVLWGKKGMLPRWYNVLDVWKDWAGHVEGREIDCGHYLAEEAPDETYEELFRFFRNEG